MNNYFTQDPSRSSYRRKEARTKNGFTKRSLKMKNHHTFTVKTVYACLLIIETLMGDLELRSEF